MLIESMKFFNENRMLTNIEGSREKPSNVGIETRASADKGDGQSQKGLDKQL